MCSINTFAWEGWTKKMFSRVLLTVVSFLLLFQSSPPVQTTVATSTSPTPVATAQSPISPATTPVPAAPSPVPPPATTPATSTPAPSNPLNTSGQGNSKESIASELAAALLRQYDTGMEGDILSQSMSDQLQVSVCSHLFLCHKLACPSWCLYTNSCRFGLTM